MHLVFIKLITGNELVKATCWTLVHSLWQGLLLAIAGGLVVLFTKKQRSSFRYTILSVLFLLFVLTACLTFNLQLRQSSTLAGSGSETIRQVSNKANPSFSHHINYTFPGRLNIFTSRVGYYFDHHASLFVSLWFIIFISRLIKLFYGLNYIRQIRKNEIKSPGSYWMNRIHELRIVLQISRPVVLMESGIIKVPMAVGWLKPIILVPMGLITHLPAEELEAILLHELAHIKRKDYFINMLQSFAEIIFFFNPAVLWISSLIREERENCCDDMAIAVTKNRTKFVHALVSFQEYNTITEYAMCFPGRKNQLLKRAQRIIYKTNNTLNAIEKTIIIFACLVMGLLTFVASSSARKNVLTGKIPLREKKVASPAYIQQQKPVVQKIAPLADEIPGNVKKDHLPQRNPVMVKKVEPPVSKPSEPLKAVSDPTEMVQRIDTTPSIQLKVVLNMLTDVTFHMTPRFSNTLKKLNDMGSLISSLKIIVSNEPHPKPMQSPHHQFMINQRPVYISFKIDTAIGTKSYKPAPINNPLADPVISGLIKENIINESVIINREPFSYTLTNDALVIDGVKQAESIFQKFYKKYIPPKGRTIRSYHWKN